MNLLDILGGVGNVLDTPGRVTRTALAGKNPLSALFDPEQGVSGRQLLEQYGLAGENIDQGWMPDAGDIGGFAAETLLDPTNLIGGGFLAKLLGKAKGAKAANKGIEAANALSQSQRAAGFMPEEIANLTHLVDETGAPKAVKVIPMSAFKAHAGIAPFDRAFHDTQVMLHPDLPEWAVPRKPLPDLPKGVNYVDSRSPLFTQAEYPKDPVDTAAFEEMQQKLLNAPTKALKHPLRSGLDLSLDLPKEIQHKLSMSGMHNYQRLPEAVLRKAAHSRAWENDFTRDRMISGLQRLMNYEGIGPNPNGKYFRPSLPDGLLPHDAVVLSDHFNSGLAQHALPDVPVVSGVHAADVYLPYIAKELQALQQVPGMRGPLAALLGHNALARSRPGQR